MTRKNHHSLGILCIGLALCISSPALAGWGSSFGGGGSFGSSGSLGGSTGSSGGSFGSRSFVSFGSRSSFGGSHGSFGSHGIGSGSLLRSIFAKHRSSLGSSGGSGSSGGTTVLSSWSGGSSGGSTGGSSGGSGGSSGLFHGGLINKLRSHHQKKMAWLRSLGSKGSRGSKGSSGSSGGSWGGSVGSSSHGGSWGGSSGSWSGSSAIVSSPVVSAPIVSEPIYSEPAYNAVYSDPIYAEPSYEAGYPVESYDGGIPIESYDSGIPVEGTIIEGTPIEAAPIETAPLMEGVDNAPTNKGSLTVSLPAEAKLFVNGRQTKSEGGKRTFVSKGLKSGYRYPYTLKAVMNLNGKEVVTTKKVSLRAGDARNIAFKFDVPVATNLTVHVPKNARLELAGSRTRSKGTTRTFVTKKLSEGEAWEDYRVIATINVGGRTITKEQTITLRGGEQRTLNFEFDDQQLAAR